MKLTRKEFLGVVAASGAAGFGSALGAADDVAGVVSNEAAAEPPKKLEKGAIIEDGPPAEVLGNPATERTRQFLSRILA